MKDSGGEDLAKKSIPKRTIMWQGTFGAFIHIKRRSISSCFGCISGAGVKRLATIVQIHFGKKHEKFESKSYRFYRSSESKISTPFPKNSLQKNVARNTFQPSLTPHAWHRLSGQQPWHVPSGGLNNPALIGPPQAILRY